jgi:hypothetical protein
MKLIFFLSVTTLLLVTGSAFNSYRQAKDPWPVPEKYMKMANPVAKKC